MPHFLNSKQERAANAAFNNEDLDKASEYYSKANAELSVLCNKAPEDMDLRFEHCFVLSRQLQISLHRETTLSLFEGRIEQFDSLYQQANQLNELISNLGQYVFPYKGRHQATLNDEIIPDIFKRLSWCAERISDCYFDYAEQEDKRTNLIAALDWINTAIVLCVNNESKKEELIQGKMYLLSLCFKDTNYPSYRRDLQAIIPPYEDIADPNKKIAVIYYHYLVTEHTKSDKSGLRKDFNECYQFITEDLKSLYEPTYAEINLSSITEAIDISSKRAREEANNPYFFANCCPNKRPACADDTPTSNSECSNDM